MNQNFKDGLDKTAMGSGMAALLGGLGSIAVPLTAGVAGATAYAAGRNRLGEKIFKGVGKVLRPSEMLGRNLTEHFGEAVAIPTTFAAHVGVGALAGLGAKALHDYISGTEDEPSEELGNMIEEKTASEYGSDFDRGFQKTAVIGTLARFGGRAAKGLSSAASNASLSAGKGVNAVTQGAKNLVTKTKQHMGAIKSNISQNFKSGFEGSATAIPYKKSLTETKKKMTREANKVIKNPAGKEAPKKVQQLVKQQKQPSPESVAKAMKAPKTAPAPAPTPKVEEPKSKVDQVKSYMSKNKTKIGVGVAAAGIGAHLASQPSEPAQAGYAY